MAKLTTKGIIDHAVAECFRDRARQDKECLDELISQKQAREKFIAELKIMKHPVLRRIKKFIEAKKNIS